MTLKIFLEVVELRTKVASVFPFAIGVLFSIAFFHEIQWLNTLLFFIGMLVFDLATTAINNYMDYEKAHSEIYKYEENVIGRTGISPKLIRNMILGMIAFVLIIGVLLTLRTGWLLLLMGVVCCFIGIFYTFGPIPLSRMPLGEIFSGFTMGLGIFAMVIYINTHRSDLFDLTISLTTGTFNLSGNIWAVSAIILAALPLVFTIANIMLANNLRDLERDIENHRYTLVFYIGRPIGIMLFQLLMYACYLILLVGLISGIFQWPILLAFLSLPKIYLNLQQFKDSLPQPISFSYSIKNMILFNSSYALGLLATILINQL
ncbi:1,4-dihydroxy-2-naphthoate polyprenyltransferase [Enterococcus sp. DIV1298c]|uniref:UbiA family prenyltransferase n=1 Tax=Candidatus Enterococcus mangumiae TaxID=2230878 RepID=A0ABZ2SV42_9ENTE|nr:MULTISPECIES: 1,4-dihydroxy-2-naphthoate polyprenyltransferase [unclassified Enterococcus]MBO0462304.1 1,4-dihydroxy-2-naphthoate polyprenyltransferase [Enterococcus sp. DIV1298c]MBO0490912.1 1,4-dihydroxy-2-naphthoate polyprenyltransferase [Enterococcus sp. DIV1094]